MGSRKLSGELAGAVAGAVALVGLALLAAPATAAEIAVDSRLDLVTVFASGAEIQRVAKFRLEPGDHTLVLRDLPAQADQRSVRVEGKATGQLEIGAVDTRRLSVPRGNAAAQQTTRRQIETEIQQLKDERAKIDVDLKAAEAQKAYIGNLVGLPGHAPQPGPGTGGREDWGALSGLIGKEMAGALKAALDAGVRLRDIDVKIGDGERRLKAEAAVVDEVTEVRIAVTAGGALDVDLVVIYQVGGAGWTPLYDARLSTGSRTVAPGLQVTRRAQITQRTGEAWKGVQLTLSTTQPAAGSSAPELRPLIVDYQSERPVAQSMPPPAAPVVGALRRSAEIAGGRDDGQLAADMVAKSVAVDATERTAAADIGTFQAIYTIPGRVDVANTGEAKRVKIDDVKLEPLLVVRSVPRVDARAFLYAKLTLPKAAPYLAGPVALFRDGTFVGNGRLPQLAGGEDTELGFGVDDAVRVKTAVIEEKRSEGGLISSTRTDQRSYRITLKNLHERPVQFTVLDQIPASNQQDIKVELTAKTTPTRKDVDDKRGVLAWDDKLAPDEEKGIDFGYRMTWPGGKQIIMTR